MARVEPSTSVRVAPVAGWVKASLLTLVAVATPIVGVTRVGEVALTVPPVPVTVTGSKLRHLQLPEPRETTSAVSPATQTILTPPGRIRLVPLCVRVQAPENIRFFLIPADTVPNEVMVAVPDTVIFVSLTVDRSVVAADAIVPDDMMVLVTA